MGLWVIGACDWALLTSRPHGDTQWVLVHLDDPFISALCQFRVEWVATFPTSWASYPLCTLAATVSLSKGPPALTQLDGVGPYPFRSLQ